MNRVAPNTLPTAAKAGGNYLSSPLVGSEARRHGYQEGIALDTNAPKSQKVQAKTCLKLKMACPLPRHLPLQHCRASPAMPSSRWRAIWALKCVSRPCRVNLSIWLTKSLCLAPRQKLHRCAALSRIQVGEGKRGPVTKRIQEAFFGLFTGETEDTGAG